MNCKHKDKDADYYRELYQPGDRLVLIKMNDPIYPVPSGTHGTLNYIDDASQFEMKWDNGCTLRLEPQIDEYRRLTESEEDDEQRLREFVDSIVKTMRPGHASQTFIMLDLEHGVNVRACEDLCEGRWHYIVAPCDFDYATGSLSNINVRNGANVAYGDAEALLNACLRVIATHLPGWDEYPYVSPAYETDDGVAKCGKCAAELVCDGNGSMPLTCPLCGKRLNYTEYAPGSSGENDRNQKSEDKPYQYLVQTRHPGGAVSFDFMYPAAIINIFGFRDCTDCDHEVFAIHAFGKAVKIEHMPATSAPFNYHRFINTETGATEFEGYSMEH